MCVYNDIIESRITKEEWLFMEKRADPKHTRLCAFCKNWYDPTNSAIEPTSSPVSWKIKDTMQKNVCLAKNNLKTSAGASCPKYECKLY